MKHPGKIIIQNNTALFESNVTNIKYVISNVSKISPDERFCFIKIKGNPGAPNLDIVFNNDSAIAVLEGLSVNVIEIK